MLEDDKNGLNKIEDMKRKLFSRNYETHIEDREGFVFFKKEKVPENWDHKDLGINKSKNEYRTPFFKNFFIFSLIFFICTLGYLFFTFFVGKNNISNENIEIAVIGNTFTKGGEKLPLIIEITNKNKVALESADLVVEYPKGSTVLNILGEIERSRKSLGSIPAASIKNEKIEVVLFGEQDSINEIKISVEYRLEGSNLISVKDKLYKIRINSTPLNFLIEGPSEITPNQEFSLNIQTLLNDKKLINDSILKIDYPFGFEIISSNIPPSIGNNIWDLSSFSNDSKTKLTIKGKIIDVYDGEEKVFHVLGGLAKKDDKSEISVVFNAFAHKILIKKPFIEAKLFVNNDYKKEYSVNSQGAIQGNINWINNLNTPIDDLEIKAKFGGNAFNWKNLSTNDGFYDSKENTIIWDKNSKDEFFKIEPLSQGVTNFYINPGSMFSASGNLLVDPSINIEVSISGKQTIIGDELKKIYVAENKVIKIKSDLSLLTKSSHSIENNSGPFPPKAEKDTVYTITWRIANTNNNVSKAKVTAFLSPRVNFKNIILPKDADLIFDNITKELVWNVGNIPKETGLNKPFKEVSFQVSYNPSLSEVGKIITLIEQATLTGRDDFANVDLLVKAKSVTTNSEIQE